MQQLTSTTPWPAKLDLFGVGVSPTTYDEAVAAVVSSARQRGGGVVSCHAVHAIVTASGDAGLCKQVNAFEMVTPDGQPVRWALNLLHRARLTDRVYGPELMLQICERAAREELSVYLYGGTPTVIDKLRQRLLADYPTLRIAGAEAPPFRPLTPDEDRAAIQRINGSGAAILFIGLGCPKQDIFAFEHRDSIQAVQICVGAAFDFHAGVKPMAPAWMQRRGLEWVFRLMQERRRLWKRYLVTNTIFVLKLARSLMRMRGL